MDAIYITLVATLPIIGVATLVYLWVRRSPTPTHAQRRKTILLVAGAATILVGSSWETVQQSRWWNFLNGTSRIALINDSGLNISDVEMVFRCGDRIETNRIGRMSPYGKSLLSAGPSELVLERISFVLGTERMGYTNSDLVTRGGLLKVRLNPSGLVSVRHE